MRFVFYGVQAGATPVPRARQLATAHGAVVLRCLAGTILLDIPSLARAEGIGQALTGWHFVPESKTAQVPERKRPHQGPSLHRRG